jgi:serine/threonine-protein kinase
MTALKETIRLKPNIAEAHFNLANALFEKDRPEEAVKELRMAVRLKPDYAEAHANLAMVLQRQGDWDGAVAALRRARTLVGSDTRITSLIDKVLQRAQRLSALTPRLPAVLQGVDRPAHAAEGANFGQLAYLKAHYGAATRLYADAFAADPRLADDLDMAHRYEAACSAALTGSGQGKAGLASDEAARAKLRRQALDWLKAALVLRKRQLESGKPEIRADVSQTLTYWKAVRDLAGVRDPEALAKFPDEEQRAWRTLWAEVDALEKKAQGDRPRP